MFQDSGKLSGSFGLTCCLLVPSLLAVGSMLQSLCNLESFRIYMNKWISLVIFSLLPGRPFQNLHYVALRSFMNSGFELSIVRHD